MLIENISKFREIVKIQNLLLIKELKHFKNKDQEIQLMIFNNH